MIGAANSHRYSTSVGRVREGAFPDANAVRARGEHDGVDDAYLDELRERAQALAGTLKPPRR